MGKAIAFLKDAMAELLLAKKILEDDNNSKQNKDQTIEETLFYFDDAISEIESLQKDIFAIGVRVGGSSPDNIEEAQRFKIFCELKDVYNENGLPYYFISYEKNLRECVASLYRKNFNSLNKDAQKMIATIMMAINKSFGTGFSNDTLQNISTKELCELIFREKEKIKNV